MKHMIYAAAILFAACSGAQKDAAENADAVTDSAKFVQSWETDSVLKVPESVLYDQANQVLYVSNIDGTEPWKADGKGSIGKVGLDGKVIAAEWVTGLENPKGLGMYGGKLYAADLTNVVVIDIASGKIESKISVAGSTGLNDIAVDGKGTLYVSDSPGKKVFKITDNKPELFLDSLTGPNGLFVRGEEIFVLDNKSVFRVKADKSLELIADGLEGNADGIEDVGDGNFVISCWEGLIWMVNADGSKHQLLDTRDQKKNTADIGYNPDTRTIYVPTFFKNTVVAYQLN